jgi:hypothetical protein
MKSLNTRHGVLTTDGIVHLWEETGYATLEFGNTLPSSIDSLMYLAIATGFTHLWIPANLKLSFTSEEADLLRNTERWDCGKDGKFISIQTVRPWKGYVTSVVGRALRPRRTENTRLIFVEQGNWPFNEATPYEILATCKRIEDRLGVAMAGSPTSVGLRYLEDVNAKYYESYFAKSDRVDWEEMKSDAVFPIQWFPVCTPDPDQEWYVHQYDRNASHPYAASQEDMGIGDPIIQVGGVFNKKYPGLWSVNITTPAFMTGVGIYKDKKLPPLLPTGSQLLPTPILRVAQMAGCEIEVIEAIVWKQSAPVFERWAKGLWSFRREPTTSPMEKQAYKSIMNNMVGSTRIGHDMDSTLRPDWYATVVGSERAVVWYKAWKLAEKYGVYPIGCYHDALYYLSTSPDPIQAVPTLLDHKDSMGGYKHVYTLKVDDQVREVLSTPLAPWKRMQLLKELVVK